MTSSHATDLSPEDVAVGDTGPEVVVSDLDRTDFVRYAGASGDFHPHHTDVAYARDHGNPDVFAHGMLTAGFGAHLVADWFGLANVSTYRVRFQDRVFPGDSVHVTGEITDVDDDDGDDDGETVVEAAIEATVVETVVLSGTATATLKR